MHKTHALAFLKRGVILLVLATLFAFALTTTTSAFHPGKALAASCIFPTLRYYPGSPFRLRYGEADFRFAVCSNQDPSSWSTTAHVYTNSTGLNLGITFSNADIYPTSGGSYYRFYTGQFHYQTCIPRIGWPCSHSGNFQVKFYVYNYQGLHVVVLSKVVPAGLALYTTP